MNSTYRSRPPARSAGPAVVAGVVVVLAAANVLTNRVLPEWSYIPFNLAVAGVVVALARLVVPTVAMGFTEWRRGARCGGTVFAVTLGLFVLAAALPGVHELFEDRRVDGGAPWLAYEAIVRIPFGTVLLEEVAFRGALLALFARWWPPSIASVWSSLLFGLWHVLPAWGISDVNPLVDRALGDGAAGQFVGVTVAVIATFVAGLWLCFLRLRSGSLLAPVLAHVATNSIGFTIAWLS